MISYQALLLEIEQLASSTKNQQDEQYIREQLSAIRALCNVALSNGTNVLAKAHSPASSVAAHPAQSFPSSPTTMQSPNIIQNTNSINGGKLEENDANGESIFDF
ncbi:YwdI family protein [Ureibacillus aquaedulcis]|uniref:YwdI family protein n=1 Tax=Ureibacillus aquaedulcis TaxID=3058421 RepID=A0ABT8GKW2_9BACL|nr:YwdI family protein [Ureibacillus sp. BA0131]MDN4492057.1 YwdI family protein [Ureibacillus sp. BA0131]